MPNVGEVFELAQLPEIALELTRRSGGDAGILRTKYPD